MTKGYDSACEELAEHFLSSPARRELIAELAQHIQDAAENWFVGRDDNGEPKRRRMNTDPMMCDTASEGAALGLLALMRGLSEEHYAAGWYGGMEYTLWRIQPGACFGMDKITERQAELLRLLSGECDGWWIWLGDGPQFIRTADWLAILRSTPTPEAGR